MGHKINPRALRLGYIQGWDSRWFAPKEMPDLLEEDFRIRKFLHNRYKLASLSKVTIDRTGKYVRVNLHTARPGVIIGKRGADIEELKKVIQEMSKSEATVNVIEVKRPELDAQLVAEGIAFQLEKNIAFRRVMKRSMERTMQSGAGGIKIMIAGRLGGAEIARTEWMMEGRVPLHTYRADIDYGFTEAHITMGRIGVKVWIFKQEHFLKSEKDLIQEAALQPIAAGVPAMAAAVEGAAAAPAPAPATPAEAPLGTAAEETLEEMGDKE